MKLSILIKEIFSKRWFIFLYLIISFITSIFALINVSWGIGLSIISASFISFVAASGVKSSFLGNKAQKIVGTLIALILMGLAIWIAQNFSVKLFGYTLSGFEWVCIGFLIVVFCADKEIIKNE